MVARREFLKTSTLIGMGTAATACASRPGDLLVVPSTDLTATDMEAYLARLDRSMNSIAVNPSPIVKIFPEKKFKLDEPVMKSGEDLMRKNLRSLLLVGSFRDLPEEGRVYPGMQARMWGAMGEMDDAMRGTHQALSALTPTERADIGRALRADPELGMRIVEAFDAESAAQGVPVERRMHLRSLGIQATNRLRQSTTMFIDEYTRKTEKILNSPVDPEELQRKLLATIGEEEFFSLQKRTSLYAEKWRLAQAAPASSPQAAPRQPTASAKDPPGTGAITAGAVLLGIGVVVLLLSIVAGGVDGFFGVTAGALLGIAGLITLIIGGAIRAANT
jgi:hypothetical protein